MKRRISNARAATPGTWMRAIATRAMRTARALPADAARAAGTRRGARVIARAWFAAARAATRAAALVAAALAVIAAPPARYASAGTGSPATDAAPTPPPASTATQTPLRLADLLAEATARNPELQAARARAHAALAVPRRVSAWDDPVLTWEAWNTPESLRIDQADNNIFRLTQKVPFPGKRLLAGGAAERDADVARFDADAVELDVLTAVKRAYYDLWHLHEKLRVYARDKALVQRIAHVAEQKYAVSEVTQADVLRAHVELTRLGNRITADELAIDGARAELNALLSRDPAAPLGVPEEPPQPRLQGDARTLTELAREHRPELTAQAAAVTRERTNVRLAERNYFPDFELGVARFQNFGQPDGFGAMASISIPLAQRAKYDAGLTEAKNRLAAVEAERRRLDDRIAREVAQAFVRARSALLQRDLFVTTHIPLGEQMLRVTESAYQAGSVDFLSLTDSVRAVEAVHLEHADAEVEFEKAYADLERAVGTPLPRADGGAPAHEGRRHE